MKRTASMTLSLAILLGLSACGNSNGPATPGVEPPIDSGSSSETYVGTHAGTRSDPYELGDTILLSAKDQQHDCTVEYTLCFDKVWTDTEIENAYPSYKMDGRFILGGTISVDQAEIDDGIPFTLRPTFITADLNEETAGFEGYKEDDLSNYLDTVYSGGTYDIIVLSGDGIGTASLAYLKVEYTDTDDQDKAVWIALPQKETSASGNQHGAGEPAQTDTPAIDATLTTDELDAVLKEQPMYVESTSYVVQDEKYKSLYPDMLQAVIKNASGTDIKNAVVAFVAWDKNDFPVKIEGQYSFGGGSYVTKCNYSDINLIDGASYGTDSGMPLDSDTDNIATFKAIVVSYDDFDGNTWNNPYYDIWAAKYEDQKRS